MTYTFMPGPCRLILQALHRRALLPGSERFCRSVNFYPDSVDWLLQFDFVRRSPEGELMLTERGMSEKVFFADTDERGPLVDSSNQPFAVGQRVRHENGFVGTVRKMWRREDGMDLAEVACEGFTDTSVSAPIGSFVSAPHEP